MGRRANPVMPLKITFSGKEDKTALPVVNLKNLRVSLIVRFPIKSLSTHIFALAQD